MKDRRKNLSGKRKEERRRNCTIKKGTGGYLFESFF